MKTFNLFLFITFIILIQTYCAYSQIDVFGRVIDSHTKLPIEGVRIQYVDKNSILTVKDTTDQHGSFELIDYTPPPGETYLEFIFKKEGYEPRLINHKLTEKYMDDVTLISYSKKIRGQFINDQYSDFYIPALEMSYIDETSSARPAEINKNGAFEIETNRGVGEKILFRIKDPDGVGITEISMVIPKLREFKNIIVYQPKKKKALTWLTGIGSLLFSAGAIYANQKCKSLYNDYLEDPINRNLYNEANNWNKGSIVSASLAGVSSVGFVYLLGKRNQKFPKFRLDNN